MKAPTQAGPSSSPSTAMHPISSFTPPIVGPSSIPVHDTRSKKVKRIASNASLSPIADDEEDIEEVQDETPVKGKGKEKAKH
ncbi:hypothetical protein B0H13DRAFT_2301503 [Mycena leptocephala]|nr:hypothetical protein B0H13DRAFT_2301503 [Mycena leptocephala]